MVLVLLLKMSTTVQHSTEYNVRCTPYSLLLFGLRYGRQIPFTLWCYDIPICTSILIHSYTRIYVFNVYSRLTSTRLKCSWFVRNAYVRKSSPAIFLVHVTHKINKIHTHFQSHHIRKSIILTIPKLEDETFLLSTSALDGFVSP
jgi:hypothetical protein